MMSCERCGGLKIVDYFYGTTAGTSAWSYEGLRCLNCGHITDLPGAEGRMTQPLQRPMGERRWSHPSLRMKDRRLAEELFDAAN
jgi:hypothetical protein